MRKGRPAVERVTEPVWRYTCQRCGFTWLSLEAPPQRCRNRACRSPYWRHARGSLKRGRPPTTKGG